MLHSYLCVRVKDLCKEIPFGKIASDYYVDKMYKSLCKEDA